MKNGHTTREAWLLEAVGLLRPIFLGKNHIVPTHMLVSCGFASTGLKSQHIGQCWPRKRSAELHNQIFISPVLSDPIEVLDTLVHELVHAVDDCQHNHGKEFKKIALSIGMKGPMRSAGAGPELKQYLETVAAVLGPYPHTKLEVTHKKRVSTPRPKAVCKHCGFQVPMFRKFVAYGPPICPKDKTDMTPIGNWDEE